MTLEQREKIKAERRKEKEKKNGSIKESPEQ